MCARSPGYDFFSRSRNSIIPELILRRVSDLLKVVKQYCISTVSRLCSRARHSVMVVERGGVVRRRLVPKGWAIVRDQGLTKYYLLLVPLLLSLTCAPSGGQARIEWRSRKVTRSTTSGAGTSNTQMNGAASMEHFVSPFFSQQYFDCPWPRAPAVVDFSFPFLHLLLLHVRYHTDDMCV